LEAALIALVSKLHHNNLTVDVLFTPAKKTAVDLVEKALSSHILSTQDSSNFVSGEFGAFFQVNTFVSHISTLFIS